MTTQHIENPDDPRLAPYRNVRDADLRGREKLFLAEGNNVVRTLLASNRFETLSVLVSHKQLKAMKSLLDAHPDVPMYVVPQDIMNSIVGFDIHRGILAAGIRNPAPDIPSMLDASTPTAAMPGFVLVLDALANHDNVGGIFRNALAFGARAVLLDPRCCDPLYRKSIRVSMGAALLVPFAQQLSTTDSISLLRAHGYTIVALTPRADAIPLASFLATRSIHTRVALCVGAEGPGLGDDILELADTKLRIEMTPGIDSLNVSVAVAIVAHALMQTGRA